MFRLYTCSTKIHPRIDTFETEDWTNVYVIIVVDRTRMSKLKRIFGFLSLAMILPLGVFLILLEFDKPPSDPFDPVRWSAEVQKRFHMADDLVRNKFLLGKDTMQLKALLGQPDPAYQPGAFVYNMGTGRAGFGVSIHSLVIRLRNGRADSVEHVVMYD